MGKSIDEKIKEDLKHCSFNGVKYSDYVKEHYIPKSDYENRLKADMVAMLTDIQLEIQEYSGCSCSCSDGIVDDIDDVIQQKIDALKEQTDGNKREND